jgi:hypothetical protein
MERYLRGERRFNVEFSTGITQIVAAGGSAIRV